MIQPLLIGIALIASFFGLLQTPTPIWDTSSLQFGATNFPTSLDSLTNPSGTDSVATVSHSGQHSNANDAIEALEAKLGIGVSTPVADTILGSSGTGISGWFTWATSTRMTATNFLATGSSTLQNFTFLNATGTNATTTNFFANNVSGITASSTTATTTNFFGADLATCQSTNALTWNGGKFGCLAVTTSGPTTFSTTTAQQMSTTTLRVSDGSLPNTRNWEITFVAPDSVGTNHDASATKLTFNEVRTTTYTQSSTLMDASPSVDNALNANQVTLYTLGDGIAGKFIQQYYTIKISNNGGVAVTGDWRGWIYATTSTHQIGPAREGMFFASTTDLITRIDIGTDDPLAMFGTSTVIRVLGY